MGLDSKLFVATKKENILEIMPKILENLNRYVREELDKYLKSKGFRDRTSYLFRDKSFDDYKEVLDFSNGVRECTTIDFRSFWVDFTIHGENRRVFVTHDCSSDYSDVHEGDKIIFSLGYWGLCNEIMEVLINTLKEYGNVYYDFNDCDEEYFVKQ